MPMSHFTTLPRMVLPHICLMLALGYAYYFYVGPIYAYRGYETDFSASRLVISILLMPVFTWAISGKGKISYHFNHIIIITIITPTLTLFFAANASPYFVFITSLCFFTIVLVSRFEFTKLPDLPSVSPQSMLVWTTFLTGVFVILIAILSGVSTPSFNLAEVYELREEINDETGSLFGYLQTLGPKSVLTLAIALACAYRRKAIIVSLLMIGFLMFGYTTHKSMIFYPILAAGMYFALGGTSRMKILIWALTGITVLAVADMWLYLNGYFSTETWLVSLVARRALITPAKLNADYVAIFSTAEFYFWSNNRITFGLIEQPYDIGPANLVAFLTSGEIYSANTGWVGSGYAQAGIFGALIYSVVIGLIFSLLDRCAIHAQRGVVAGASIVPVFAALTSTDLFTALLTHGLGLTVILLMLIAQPSANRINSRNVSARQSVDRRYALTATP